LAQAVEELFLLVAGKARSSALLVVMGILQELGCCQHATATVSAPGGASSCKPSFTGGLTGWREA